MLKVLCNNSPKVLKNAPDRSMRLFLTPTAAHTIHNSNWKYICQMLLHATRRGGRAAAAASPGLFVKQMIPNHTLWSVNKAVGEGEKHILLRFLAP